MEHEALHGGHGGHAGNKKTALLIAVLALVLAFAETLGKSSQTAGLSFNIEAANLWSFYQAKTIRQTAVRTALEHAEIEAAGPVSPEARALLEKRTTAWRDTIARYDSEPSTQEGRKELMARAKEAEARRDRSLAAYHHYELASAALQIAVVLASAEIITGAAFLTWLAGALGLIGLAFCGIGFLAPTAVHFG